MLIHVIILVSLGANLIQAVTLEEALAEVERARNRVVRAIQGAHINLDYHYGRFENFTIQVDTEAQIVIRYEEQVIHWQVDALKEVAETAGRDISPCLGNYEQNVSDTTNGMSNDLRTCISDGILEAEKIINEYKYLIDITINRIEALVFQLSLCDPDNQDCITPLYEVANYENMWRPEHIEIQVLGANNMINALMNTVQQCSNLFVNEFVSYTNAFLKEVADCADSIIAQ